MSCEPFHLKPGDRLPVLFFRLETDGAPVPLAGDEEVRFRMRGPGGLLVDAPATIAVGAYTMLSGQVVTFTAEDGVVLYEWQEGDVPAVGRYEAQFVAQIGGRQATFPNSGFIPVIATATVPAAP